MDQITGVSFSNAGKVQEMRIYITQIKHLVIEHPQFIKSFIPSVTEDPTLKTEKMSEQLCSFFPPTITQKRRDLIAYFLLCQSGRDDWACPMVTCQTHLSILCAKAAWVSGEVISQALLINITYKASMLQDHLVSSWQAGTDGVFHFCLGKFIQK